MNKNKLKLTPMHIINLQTRAKYQTKIDSARVEKLLMEWNEIVVNYDDPQDLFLYLHRYSYNKFLMGHSLIDGNKRMHRFLTERINKEIKYIDIL